MREQARQQPGAWLYTIDPFFTETGQSGEVPPFGIVGAYQVDATGQILPDFTPNPNYRPSPIALGLPAPTNSIEAALQLAATGYGDDQQLLTALLSGEVLTPIGPEQDSVMVIDEGQDRNSVLAYTSKDYLPEGWTEDRTTRIPVRTLMPALTGRYLTINLDSRLTVRIPGEDLANAPV
jgi:hypothetical protein